MDWHVALLAFVLIFPVELPDKTFVASLVLSTRFRPVLVWIGVGVAFGVQCVVAVAAGQAVSYLPAWVVHALSTAMFLAGAVVLVKTAPGADVAERRQEEELSGQVAAEAESEAEERPGVPPPAEADGPRAQPATAEAMRRPAVEGSDAAAARTGGRPRQDSGPWRALGASFLLIFAAEWGDLSQILTLNMAARYHAPVAVFVGSWVALLTVSGLAVVAGRVLLRYLRLSLLHYIAAGVCLAFAGVGIYELVHGLT